MEAEDLGKDKKSKDFEDFKKFQTFFYTSIDGFNTYTDYEIRKHAFMLMNNMGKGLPNLVDDFINLYSPDVKTLQSPAIIRALQRRFVNGFSYARIPQFIYLQSSAPKKEPKAKAKLKVKAVEKGLDFSPEVNGEIQSHYMLDSKTFESVRYTTRVQELGKALIAEYSKEVKQSK